MNKNQTLILVEGEHEKETLLHMLMLCFPEIPIDKNNILVFRADIYDLYHSIEVYYGRDWYDDIDVEINLPLLISERDNIYPIIDKRKITNIIMMFDFEHHDTSYSDDKILRMQHHFNSMTDDGMLYINYPMIESYMDMSVIPDPSYFDKKISVKLSPGEKYKKQVNEDSALKSEIELLEKANATVNKIMDGRSGADKVILIQKILGLKSAP